MNMNRAKCGIMSQLLKEVNALSWWTWEGWTWEVRMDGFLLGHIALRVEPDGIHYDCSGTLGNTFDSGTDFMKALSKFIPRSITCLSDVKRGMVGSIGCVKSTDTYFSIDSEEYDDKEDLLFYRLNHDSDSNLHFITAFELNYGVLMKTIELVK